jgi:hypothetical protein
MIQTKSNLIGFCFLLFCFGSCHSQNNTYFSINNNCNNCEYYIYVSTEIEEDSLFNKILSAYIYNALIGEFDCEILTEDNLKKLYLRPSFKQSIILFYTDSNLQKLSPYDDVRDWTERYIELLFRISDLYVLHDIANELLNVNQFDGLWALWDKADTSKLSNLNKYLKGVDESNFYECADLAAFFKVANILNKSEKYLLKASKIKSFEFEYNILIELLKSEDKLNYMDYKEAIYGGM